MTDSLLELQAKAMAKADFHLVTFVQEKFLNYHVSNQEKYHTFTDHVILLRLTLSR